MGFRRITSVLVAVCSMAIGAVAVPPVADAAEPGSGTLGPSTTSVSWRGPHAVASAGRCSGSAPTGPVVCDRFELDLELPSGYWRSSQEGLRFRITWTDPSDSFRLCVTSPRGTQVCEGEAAVVAGRVGAREYFLPHAESGTYQVLVAYEEVADSGYDGIATIVRDPVVGPRFLPPVSFAPEPIRFGPSTVVTAHFLGTEPMTTLEHPMQSVASGALDADRVFVDWPLGSTSQIGQLARSEDGGDSFRLLFDIDGCPERSRPNCGTSGGGDTDVDVNPVNGNLYFTDLESLGNVAFASSTDHGDTFPPARQAAVSNPLTAIDRQWVAGARPGITTVDDGDPLTAPLEVEAFMSYEVGLMSKVIQGIDASGRPIPQPRPQIPDTSGRTGPLRVDSTGGPGDGWLYQPVGDPDNGRYSVATVHASNYRTPVGETGGWQVNVVGATTGTIPLFSWLALDREGNAYTVWVQEPGSAAEDRGWRVQYSFSDLSNPANHPATGRPGSVWSEPVDISPPGIGSTIFPQVIAGDGGRIAIAYVGTTDHVGDPQEAPPSTRWNVYGSVITDGLARSGAVPVRTGVVGHRTMHTGSICWGGAGCEAGVPEDPTGVSGGGDRSLADMIDVGFDAMGRVAVVYGDNHSSFAYLNPGLREKPFPHFAKQVSGPPLLEGVGDVQVTEPAGGTDASGDATWPNRADGVYLPALDILGASLTLEGSELVARIPLKDASPSGMARDLQAYSDSYPTIPSPRRLQYVLRFMSDDEIYHLSMEHLRDGDRRFFGGRLDQNDRLVTSDAYAFTNGAGYHTDGVQVTGSIQGNTLVIHAPAAGWGPASGTRLFSVTAFAMGGPLEADESTIEDIMRTVDASAPFDTTLASRVTASPTATRSTGTTSSPTASSSGGSGTAPDGTPTDDPEVAAVALSLADATDRPGRVRTVTATAFDVSGEPVVGAGLTWASAGVGAMTSTEAVTDRRGSATALVYSDAPGDQTVTVAAECGGSSCADTVVVHWGPDRCDVFGTDGNDFIEIATRGEVVCAFGGADVVVGGAGDDALVGGAGSDRLFGGGGDDRLWGRVGTDELRGGSGRDRLIGGRGADVIFGGPGIDTCRDAHGDRMRSCRG